MIDIHGFSESRGCVVKGVQHKQPATAVATEIITDSANCSFFPDTVAVTVASCI